MPLKKGQTARSRIEFSDSHWDNRQQSLQSLDDPITGYPGQSQVTFSDMDHPFFSHFPAYLTGSNQ